MKGRLSMNSIIKEKLFQHELWIDSVGRKGQKLLLEDLVFEDKAVCNMNVSDSMIVGCKFERAKIQQIECSSSNLCSSTFSFSALSDCNAIKADFCYSDFLCTTIETCNLSKTDLSGCAFKRCKIANCELINSLLSDCILENVEFEQIDFSGAYLDGVTFGENVVFRNVIGLSNAHMKEILVRLPSGDLQGSAAIEWLLKQE